MPVLRNIQRLPIIEITYKFQQTCSYSALKIRANWQSEKDRIMSLPNEEKRKLYKSEEFITADKVESWSKYYVENKSLESERPTGEDVTEFQKIKIDSAMNKELAAKVAIFKGDITKLEVDAIVNAANSLLKAGGGVDGAIHKAAGPLLQVPELFDILCLIKRFLDSNSNPRHVYEQECNSLGGCPTGEARITGGYNLPAKYVIHTVGPQNGSAPILKSCYENSLAYASRLQLRSIAFPCISTGIYGFPNRLAAHIALSSARQYLEKNSNMKKIIFCTFMPVDVDIYETLMQMYFPIH